MNTASAETNTVAVIGAGPAGLMAAERLAQQGCKVHVFDVMPTAARKFLMAGVGGMNITHSEPLDTFISRYQSDALAPFIHQFPPQQLRQWIHALGIETFVGSSGRVFPSAMKAAPLLRRWLQALREQGVVFFMRHQWLGFGENNTLFFQHGQQSLSKHYNTVVLALGGGSWPKLGSTGSWQAMLQQQGIAINPLKPANCGFHVDWSPVMQQNHAGKPIKNACFSLSGSDKYTSHGECVITDYGIEGGAVYALSSALRNTLEQQKTALLCVDLLPYLSQQALVNKLGNIATSRSTTTLLRKKTGLSATAIALLYEYHPKEALRDVQLLAAAIKKTEIPLTGIRPLAEAISSAGGIPFHELNDELMLNKLPGVFCAGEMLDWDAPTGGYLLTACFATGKVAGDAAAAYCKAL